jgi:prolyl oligopeptidase
VLRKKGARPAGGAKTVLYGYGGFAIPTRPGFQEQRKAWLERGGVWAIANLRGGAEFGEAWHQAGSKTHKQNTFDDFAAAAKHLVELGYTKPDKLAVMGGSNGGLTVGALVTQHPELARAAVATVGLFDALRIERSTNGVFNVTEYGSTADEAQFQALHAYSPYHHVSDGTKYPATLMMTGANDPRVDPMHSRKMTARLQAAQEKTTAADRPILLRTAASGGHGLDMALSERIAEQADSLGFLWHELE